MSNSSLRSFTLQSNPSTFIVVGCTRSLYTHTHAHKSNEATLPFAHGQTMATATLYASCMDCQSSTLHSFCCMMHGVKPH